MISTVRIPQVMFCASLLISEAAAAESLGNCEVSISGEAAQEFSGQALHMEQALPSGDRRMVALYRYINDGDFTAVMLLFNDNHPQAGSASIGENSIDRGVVVTVMYVSGGSTLIGSPLPDDPGTLRIEKATGHTISGQISFNGEMANLGDQREIHPFSLTASFSAAAGRPEDLPGVLGQSAGASSQ